MFTRRDGTPWDPEYLIAINAKTCIGCGRCFKVCGRDVMNLRGINAEGELVPLSGDDDDDDEFEHKIMVLDNPGNCIGCTACARVCPKNCQTHVTASQIASSGEAA